MRKDELLSTAQRKIEREMEEIGYEVSSEALSVILEDIKNSYDIIIIKEAAGPRQERLSESDIVERSIVLMKVAGLIADKERRKTIMEHDVLGARAILCPTFWPFC